MVFVHTDSPTSVDLRQALLRAQRILLDHLVLEPWSRVNGCLITWLLRILSARVK